MPLVSPVQTLYLTVATFLGDDDVKSTIGNHSRKSLVEHRVNSFFFGSSSYWGWRCLINEQFPAKKVKPFCLFRCWPWPRQSGIVLPKLFLDDAPGFVPFQCLDGKNLHADNTLISSKSPSSVAAPCEFGKVQFWWIQKIVSIVARNLWSNMDLVSQEVELPCSLWKIWSHLLVPNKFMSRSHHIWFPKRDPLARLFDMQHNYAQFVNQNVAVWCCLCYDRGSRKLSAKLDGWNTKPDQTKSVYVTSFWILLVPEFGTIQGGPLQL